MDSPSRADDPSERSGSGPKGRLLGAGRDPRVVRIAKFGAASGIGFLVAEVLLILGATAYYHATAVSDPVQTAPVILALDVISFGTGVTVAFLINERVNVGGPDRKSTSGRADWFVRWGKFQAASLLGNVVIVGVQLVLLATTSLKPALGSVIGAIVSYPMTYAISMRFVWKADPARESAEPLDRR
jgi:putative flippase GtrA